MWENKMREDYQSTENGEGNNLAQIARQKMSVITETIRDNTFMTLAALWTSALIMPGPVQAWKDTTTVNGNISSQSGHVQAWEDTTKVNEYTFSEQIQKRWFNEKIAKTVAELSAETLDLIAKWELPEWFIVNVEFTSPKWYTINTSNINLLKYATRSVNGKTPVINDYTDAPFSVEEFKKKPKEIQEQWINKAYMELYWIDAFKKPDREERMYLNQFLNDWYLLFHKVSIKDLIWSDKVTEDNYEDFIEEIFSDKHFDDFKRKAVTHEKYNDKEMKKLKSRNSRLAERWKDKLADWEEEEKSGKMKKWTKETFFRYLNQALGNVVYPNIEVYKKITTSIWWIAYVEHINDDKKKRKLDRIVASNVATVSALTNEKSEQLKYTYWKLKYSLVSEWTIKASNIKYSVSTENTATSLPKSFEKDTEKKQKLAIENKKSEEELAQEKSELAQLNLENDNLEKEIDKYRQIALSIWQNLQDKIKSYLKSGKSNNKLKEEIIELSNKAKNIYDKLEENKITWFEEEKLALKKAYSMFESIWLS